MKQPQTSRRNFFFLTLGAASAAVLAIKTRPSKARTALTETSAAGTADGYRKTAHIETYYRSARF